MAKIAELDQVAEPDGTETVLVLKLGVAKRAELGALVGAAFEYYIDVPLITALQDMLTIAAPDSARVLSYRDRHNRELCGFDHVLGGFYAPRLFRAGQVDVYEEIARASADSLVAKAGVNIRMAQLRTLRLGEARRVMTTAPKISRATGATAIASGTTIAWNDRRITYSGGAPVIGTGSPYNTVGSNLWITSPSGANRMGHDWSQRFVTDATQFEMVFGDWNGASSMAVMVDGEIIARRAQMSLPNAGNYQFVKIDFGDDTQTIVTTIALAGGGTGYAIGDELTIAGGTGAGAVVVVTGVSSGVITNFYIKSEGAYTVVPGNGAGVTGGTGSGATFNVTAQATAQSGHTTRRMRRIEIIGRGTRINGLRVPTNSIVRPWPVSGPRLFAMTDSYGDTFASAGQGWPFRLGQRLGIEDVWINGVGSTGFLATNGGTYSKYRDRLGDFAARMPGSTTPAILLVQGSINDSGSTAAAIQAEVEAFWTQAFTTEAYADMYFAQIGIMRSSAVTPSQAQYDAVKAGFAAAQAAHDPNGRRSAFIETRGSGYELLTQGGKAGATTGAGNTDYWGAGDGAHPTQAGMDFIGDMLATDLLAAIQNWS